VVSSPSSSWQLLSRVLCSCCIVQLSLFCALTQESHSDLSQCFPWGSATFRKMSLVSYHCIHSLLCCGSGGLAPLTCSYIVMGLFMICTPVLLASLCWQDSTDRGVHSVLLALFCLSHTILYQWLALFCLCHTILYQWLS
jgi:hypothetical protein